MRTPPNALDVFGMTGAIGASRVAVSIALAELNGNRLARAPAAAARPNVKRLRVESSPMKIICPRTQRRCKYCANAAFRRRCLGTSTVQTCSFRRESAHLGAAEAGTGGKTRKASIPIFSLSFLHSLMVLTTLDSDRVLLLLEYLSRARTISSYPASVVTGSFGTMCTIS